VRILSVARDAVFYVAIAMFVGCGGSQLPITATGAIPSAARQPLFGTNYKSIYSFGANSRDGSLPNADLVAMNGKLYSTTLYGGRGGRFGEGTIFEISPAGSEQVLHRFRTPEGGRQPVAGLAVLNGTFYGTTFRGGTGGFGTAFRMTASGKVTVLHRFTGPDGEYPAGDLVTFKGVLYGTTEQGGNGCGNVFELSPSGKERVVYSFRCGTDGASPSAGVVVDNGALYGTTLSGGSGGGLSCNGGCGTVFEVSPSGMERVVYSFTGGKDGYAPTSGVVDVNGVLYGTTSQGGGRGLGKVFEIDASGKEHGVYSFRYSPDGAIPAGRLIARNGWLYGITESGGYNSLGTIFRVNTSSRKEDVLHSFGSGADGEAPHAGLVALNGTLFGTTEAGGTAGVGTVFSVSGVKDQRD
jgi:uncharacterized repeat protein (TIGR03803 family)